MFHCKRAFSKKLNTYGVESPCERLPGVGSFLANPGLSKEQLVPSCTMRAFIIVDVSIEIMVHFGRLFIRMLASIVLQNERFNAVGVALLIAQGCQTIVKATQG